MPGATRSAIGNSDPDADSDGDGVPGEPLTTDHLVDFDLLATRNLAYRPFEACRLAELESEHG